MQLSVEISMYPLDTNYIPPIQAFLDQLNQYDSIKVKTNSMSTQLFGPYDEVMRVLQESIKSTYIDERKIVMVLKMINADLDYTYETPA